MRTPSDRKELYRHWAEQLKAIGDYPSVKAAIHAGLTVLPFDETPRCGFYKRRMIAGGPYVPVRIFLEQHIGADGELLAPEVLKCQIGPDFYDALAEWSWVYNRPISQAAYRLMIAEASWAKSQVVTIADPDIQVDFLTAPPPMFKKKRTRHVGRPRPRRAPAARS